MRDVLPSFAGSANRHAGKLLLLGLAGVAWYNWRQLQRDKARLSERGEPERLPSLTEWPDLPQVSVLVAAWNEAELIARHIESFLELRYPHKELVLCAGGEDGTCKASRQYIRPEVTVLEQRLGEGKQRALQRCFAQATGEVIFLTDADCLLSDEAFERTLKPIVDEGETVTTGGSRPLPEQRHNPFVLLRWFTDIHVMARRGRYTDGILGRNAAVRRTALHAVGGFQAPVSTGTDYYLARQLLGRGHRIRHVGTSTVDTEYAQRFRRYQAQQTRWLRNGVLHGLRFGANDEVVRCLLPSLIGWAMLSGPVLVFCLGRVMLVVWTLLFAQAVLGRIRYIKSGEMQTDMQFPVEGYLWLPFYTFADFLTWATALIQYPFEKRRHRW